MRRRIEGDAAIAGGHQRLDELAELRAAPGPAVHEHHRRPFAPLVHGDPLASVVHGSVLRAPEQRLLACGRPAPQRPKPQIARKARRERRRHRARQPEQQTQRHDGHRQRVSCGTRRIVGIMRVVSMLHRRVALSFCRNAPRVRASSGAARIC